MLGWGQSAYDSLDHFNQLIRSDGDFNATGYANRHVDDLIHAIETALVTYARDAMIEEVWRTVRDDIVYVPFHHQVIVWAMRDQLEAADRLGEPAAVPPSAAGPGAAGHGQRPRHRHPRSARRGQAGRSLGAGPLPVRLVPAPLHRDIENKGRQNRRISLALVD
jgi:hypothetical protein